MKSQKISRYLSFIFIFLLLIAGIFPFSLRAQTYCTSGATNSGDSEIDSVALNTISKGTSGICATYSDFTTISTTLRAASFYTLYVTLGSCGGNYFKSASAWIDYNDDGDFQDTNEFIGNIGQTTQTATVSLRFLVSSVNVDYYDSLRLRIVMREGGFPSDCGTFSWGETEDYTIFVLPPLANDAAMFAIDSPSFPLIPGSRNVKVRIFNSGSDTLKTAGIDWKVNGSSQTGYSWSGNLPFLDTSQQVSIGSYNFTTGVNLIKTWTKYPNSKADSNNLNDTMEIALYACHPLSGTYTIGKSASDSFSSFNAAVSKLINCGISGAVVFKVDTGTFSEQITIPAIYGTSSSNTITFESKTGDSSSVVLTYGPTSSSDNYTVQLNGANHVTFRNMTLQSTGSSYTTVIYLTNASTSNTFSNNRILAAVTTSTSANYRLVYINSASLAQSYNSFIQNYFSNGSYGIYWMGYINDYDQGGLIANNFFENQYYNGIYTRYIDSLKINNNLIWTNTSYTYFYGIRCYSLNNYLRINANIIVDSNNYGGYGIFLNNINGSSGRIAVVANNFVSYNTYSSSRGIYVSYCSFLFLNYNSVNITGSGSNSAALYYDGTTGTVRARNNIFSNAAGGYSMYMVTDLPTVCDYNDLYTSGANLCYHNYNFSGIASWQATTSRDAHSLSILPGFTSNTDLHIGNVFLNGKALPIPTSVDIDGETRNATNPDIGADEFTPAANDAGIYSLDNPSTGFQYGTVAVKVGMINYGNDTLKSDSILWQVNGVSQTPYSWTGSLPSADTASNISLGNYTFSKGKHTIKAWTKYPNSNTDADNSNDTLLKTVYATNYCDTFTIGGSGADFSTIKDAIDSITLYGICGPVVFLISSGTYNEQLNIQAIPNASATNTITFQSASGDSTSVILTYSPSGSSTNYVAQFGGGNYITFKNVTLKNSSTNYGRVIYLTLNSSNITIENCVIEGAQLNNTSSYFALVYSMYNYIYFNNTFQNNLLKYGSYAFYLDNNDFSSGLQIINNVLQDQYYRGMHLSRHNAPIIHGNTISTNSIYSSYYGIYCYYCHNGVQVTNNYISDYNVSSGYGIYMNRAYGNSSAVGLLANNFISWHVTGTATGIYLYYPQYLSAYHNSVNIYGSGSSSRAIYYYGYYSGINILNNIFSNEAGGYAVNYSNPPENSDYNDLYTTGNYVGYFNNNYANLTNWQSAISRDTNSVSVPPAFISSTDLHTFNSVLNDAGLAVAQVTTDYDGETRSTTKPDIGADEFTPPSIDAGVFSIDEPVSPFSPGNKPVKVSIVNYGLDTLFTAGIDWKINGVSQSSYSWSGTLLPSDTAFNIQIGTFSFVQGTHAFKAWTKNPNSGTDGNNANDTFSTTLKVTNLCDTFTIGSSGADFPSFNSAIDSLNTYGICGPVVFLVKNGTYTEQISIGQISGASATNTITFTSQNADSSLVTLQYAPGSSNNYVIQLNGAQYVNFSKMTIKNTGTYYGYVLYYTNGASYNTFNNNIIQGINTTNTSTNYALIYANSSYGYYYNELSNNHFKNGSYGMYFYYNYYGLIHGNVFTDQYYMGLRVLYSDYIKITNNIVSTNSTLSYFYGIYTHYCDYSIIITGNQVYDSNLSSGVGIYMYRSYSQSSTPGLIANNFVSLNTTSSTYGIYLYYPENINTYHNSVNITGSGSSSRALYYYGYYSGINFLNNIFSNQAGGYSTYFGYNLPSNSNYNDLYSTGSNLGYYNSNSNDLSSWQTSTGRDTNSLSTNPYFWSYKNLHTYNSLLNGVAKPLSEVTTDIDGDIRDTLNPDIGADEFDQPSVDAGVFVLDSPQTTFHSGSQTVEVGIKNFGVDTITSVSIDWKLNGVAQSTYNWTGTLPASDTVHNILLGTKTFGIGQHTIKAWTKNPNSATDGFNSNDTLETTVYASNLCDTFTIGGVGADFPTFTSAIDSLEYYGICGPVVFLVSSGSYNEQLVIHEINGASATNTITFQSASGDSTDVILYYYPSSSSYNYVVKLDGADYVTLQNMTLKSTYYYYGRVIEFANSANYNKIYNNYIENPVYSSSSSYRALIYSSSSNTNEYNDIYNNHLMNGSYGIYWGDNNYAKGNKFRSNTFTNPYYIGMYVYYQNGVIIENNTITTNSTYSSFYGIELYYVQDDFQLSGNKIDAPTVTGDYGIYVYYAQCQASKRGLIANNFVRLNCANNYSYGIYLYGDYVNVFYNSVNLTGTDPNGYLFYYDYNYSGNTSVLNNIFCNQAGGYTIYTYGGLSNCNYNDLYTSGSYLAYYNGNRSDLNAWTSYSGFDSNSLSIDPQFTSNSDLHMRNLNLNGKATPRSEVTTDIDGESRDATSPDIGADEFIPPANDAGIIAFDAPGNIFHSGSNTVKVTLKNHGTDTLFSAGIDWSINGVGQSGISWSGSLVAGDTAQNISLGSHNFSPGNITLRAWSKNPNSTTDGYLDNDTFETTVYATHLCDTFTIGGSGADFPSFQSAVDSLHTFGICGPIVFQVTSGTYYEQISINEILGASSTNTITFMSASGDSTDVILSYSPASTTNYLVQLNGADYVTFKNITLKNTSSSYGRIVELTNKANYNKFYNNVLEGLSGNFTSDYMALVYSNNSFADNYNEIVQNHFKNGSFGIYLYSPTSTNYENHNLIRKNWFENPYYMGIYAVYEQYLNIEENIITANPSYSNFYGIYAYYCDYDLHILKNNISNFIGGRGIYVYNGDISSSPTIIANNFISSNPSNTTYGLMCYYANYSHIYHNSINITGNNSNTYAFYNYRNYYANIKNNSFSNQAGGYAYWTYYSTSNQTFYSDFNNLYSNGTYLGFYSYYNIYITDLGAWKSNIGSDTNSISEDPEYFNATDLHTFSLNLDEAAAPVSQVTDDFDGESRNSTKPDIGADEFTPPDDDAGIIALNSPTVPFKYGSQAVQVTLKNFATDTLLSVTIDWQVNGVNQSPVSWTGMLVTGDTAQHVVLGNYNFPWGNSTIKAWTKNPNASIDGNKSNDTLLQTVTAGNPLSGTYTIGAYPTDSFYDFGEAVDSLNANGVAGAVIFIARDSTYNEQITINQITGASATHTITFRSASADSTKVTLSYNSAYSNNWIIYLNGADYITFKQIEIKALNNSYGRAVYIHNGAENILFEGNIFTGTTSNTTSSYHALVYSNGSLDNNNVFRNNLFSNGAFGIYMYGINSSSLENGTIIENNVFSNQYYMGIYTLYQDAIQIKSNLIQTNRTYTGYYGIYTYYCHNAKKIESNQIYIQNGGFGFRDYYSNGTASYRGLFANNFIQIGGTSGCYGIYFYGSTYQDIYHNNINITNTYTSSYGVYNAYGGNCNMINNIICNAGGGYSIFMGSTYTFSSCNYNDLYTTGTYLCYYNGNRSDLAAWRSASPFGDNSLSVDPLYYTSTDLHVKEFYLNNAGQALSEVSIDIDGESRHSSTPDMGADEFSPPSNDAGILAILNPAIPFLADTQQIVVRLRNYGVDTLKSASIKWTVNNITQTPFSWSGSLLSGDTTYVVIGNYLFKKDTLYAITSWTSQPNNLADGNTSNDTFSVGNLYPALSGLYTLGGSSPDYSSFTAAALALSRGGVIDSAWFDVRAASYTEQFVLNPIIGSTTANTVVFRSESGDSTDVTLQYPGTSSGNYVVYFNGADGVTFRDMTLKNTSTTGYGYVISINNDCDNLRFASNVIEGINTSSTSSNYRLISDNTNNDDNLIFNQNHFKYGSFGIYSYGTNTSYRQAGFKLLNNFFDNQSYFALYSYYHEYPVISGNTITLRNGNNSKYAIHSIYTYNGCEISNNIIHSPNPSYSVYLQYCYGNSSSPLLISNNFISVDGTYNSTSTGLYLYYCDYANIYYNSVNMSNTYSNSSPFYLYYGNLHNIKNNIFANTGGGYSFTVYSGTNTISSCDYNDLYSSGATLGYWNASYSNLTALKAATSLDAHSISIDPLFISSTDLHVEEVTLNKKAIPISGITTDIDGETRDVVNPDIGADEFDPPQTDDAGVADIIAPKIPFAADSQMVKVVLSNFGSDSLKSVTINWKVNGVTQTPYSWTGGLPTAENDTVSLGKYKFLLGIAYDIVSFTTNPNGVADSLNNNDSSEVQNLYAGLGGTYTIGGGYPNFSSFAHAVSLLNVGGVVDTVIFNVRNGTYIQQLKIKQYPGASASRPVIFQSESGDSSKVILTYNSGTYTQVLELDGADYISFRKITLTTAASNYMRILSLINGADYNHFENCVFHGVISNSTTNYNAIIYSSSGRDVSNVFTNNLIQYGSYGFYMTGSSSNYESGTKLIGNTIRNQYYMGMYLTYQDAPQFISNQLTSSSLYSNYYGAYLYSCYKVKFQKNKISQPGGYGIYAYSTPTSDRSEISNNFIHCGSASNSYGIYLYYSSYWDILFNNINISGSGSSNYGMYMQSSSSIQLRNNNIVNNAGKYAIYGSGSGFTASDYNNIYSSGIPLAYWNANQSNLSAWKSATSQDAHSLSVDPLYLTPSDLHVREINLNESGMAISGINTDIDGESRHPTKPDIGADEFEIPYAADAGITDIVSPEAPFASDTQQVRVLLKNFGYDTLQSATIKWSVAGNSQTPYNWTGNLLPGRIDTVTIGNYLFNINTNYTIKAFSINPNNQADSLHDNDSSIVYKIYAALAGTYTIGGTSPDFASFTEAVTNLNLGGIVGAVVFDVRDGVYTEQFRIREVNGSSASNTILFRSESEDSLLVKITYNGTSSNNYVVHLNGADYVGFEQLSIQNTHSYYGIAVYLNGAANYCSFENCILEGYNTSSSTTNHSVIYADNSNQNYLTLSQNIIRNGYYGLLFNGNNSVELLVENNIFQGQYYCAMQLNYLSDPVIRGNQITLNDGNIYAIGCYLTSCQNSYAITANQFDLANGGTAIYLNSSDGTSSNRALIANNFIHVGGVSTSVGIYYYYVDYLDIHFNSIHITGSHVTNGKALHAYYGSSINVYNNVFENSGGGYAIYVYNTGSLSACDYNDIHSSGSNMAYWNGNRSSLSAWTSNSGFDQHSKSLDPLFYSVTDLHTSQVQLDSSAMPISGITIDIDGEYRSSTKPDIGADEFTYVSNDVGVSDLVSPVSACGLSSSTPIKVRIQNFGGLSQTGFNVSYIINGGSAVTENIGSVVIARGNSYDYTFNTTADLSAYGAFNITIYSSLSADSLNTNDTLHVTLNNYQAPSLVSNMVPADLATNLSLPISFSWSVASGATNYDLYIWADSLTQPITPKAANLTQISYLFTGSLNYGVTYKWRIHAKNAYCSAGGPIQKFTLRSLPDLIVNSVTLPSTSFSGTSINVNWQIKNNGSGSTQSASWYDLLYLSDDNLFDASVDQYVGGFSNFSSLGVGQSYSQTQSINLPQGISGSYYVFVLTDKYNYLLESDENNNTGVNSSAMTVQLTPPPDLIVSSIVTPNNVFSGTSMNIMWTVKNDGSGNTTTNSWYDALYMSTDTTLNASAVYLGRKYHSGALYIDSSYTTSQSVNIPDAIYGRYYFYVQTDIYNHEYEHALENNNVKRSDSVSVKLTPPPDLVVSSVMGPDSVHSNQTISLGFAIKNQGGNSPDHSWYDRIFISSTSTFNSSTATSLGTNYHNSVLDPGSTDTLYKTVTIPKTFSGQYYFFVQTDYRNDVFEFNYENNNVSTADPVYIKLPDLRPVSISNPDTGSSGKPMLVLWKDRNLGPGNLISQSWSDKIYLSSYNVYHADSVTLLGTLSKSGNVNAWTATASSKTVTLPDGISGTHYIYIRTDGNGQIKENAENNNLRKSDTSIYIKLSPWPDLEVTSISLPDSGTAGGTALLNFTVKNTGTSDANGSSWKDYVYLSKDSVFNLSTATYLKNVIHATSLAPNGTYNITTTLGLATSLSAATYYIYVFTDKEDKIYEHIDNYNNVSRGSFYINGYPPVDLKVMSVSSPDSSSSGKQINVSYTIKNIGQAKTLAGSYMDAIYLSTDSVWSKSTDTKIYSENRTSALQTGVSYSNSKTITLPNGISGTFYLLVVTDENDANNDDNFANNYRSRVNANNVMQSIYIALTLSADLTITAFSAPTTGTAGQPITVNWTVKNTGVGPTTFGSVREKFYLSTDLTIDNSDVYLGTYTKSGNMAVNESYSHSMQLFLPGNSSGNKIVMMKTDADNNEYEHNGENNNTSSGQIFISDAPPSDLIVSDLSFPSTVIAGESITVQWKVKNIGVNPATGYVRDAVYISNDTEWDVNDKLFGTKQYSLNLAPNSEYTQNMNDFASGLAIGYYHIIVRTDILDYINEANDTNNQKISADSMQVTVLNLPFYVLTYDTLNDNEDLYYKIESIDTLLGETMLLTLKGDSVNGANELYLRYMEIPTRIVYDYSYSEAFKGNQEIIVPSLYDSTYYILIYGNTSAGAYQQISLYAEILHFEIRSVVASQGGNTGNVTLLVNGSKFDSSMTVKLNKGSSTIVADTVIYVDPTRVFATFNLSEADSGYYTVIAEKTTSDTTSLYNGFKVNTGLPADLQVNVVKPANSRPNSILTMRIDFLNNGNIDLPTPVLKVISLAEAPIGLSALGLANGYTELDVELRELNGPQDVLRPGASGSVIIYTRSSKGLGYSIMMPSY